MKTKLLFAMLLFSSITFSQTWNQIHTKPSVNFATTAVKGNNLYVAYTDVTNQNPYVMKYDGTNWSDFNGGNALSQESISKNLVLSTGDSRQNKIHVGYINSGITKVEWYESNNGGNFTRRNSTPPTFGTTTVNYNDGGLRLFINITGQIPGGYIYNARIGTRMNNLKFLGGISMSGNTSGSAGSFYFPKLATVRGRVADNKFDYVAYNETFVVERNTNGQNFFGKIITSSTGTSFKGNGKEQTNGNNYSKISGIVGEIKFAAYDATNNVVRVALSPDGNATTTNGIFQRAINASNGIVQFKKFDGNYYVLYADTNNALQIDKYDTATSTWSTLTNPNITTTNVGTYKMYFYDGKISLLYTDVANNLIITQLEPDCTVNIADANFKNALLDHGVGITGTGISTIDTNRDNEIQCSEAQAYRGAINVANRTISNLTGIEEFVNIDNLDCQGNQLTTLDLKNNTGLSALNCKNNNLSNVYVNNGTNTTNALSVVAEGNPIACIQHDSGFQPTANWTKDATATWSTNCAAASVNDYSFSNALTMYPNPVTTVLNIATTQSTISTVELYNVLGKKVLITNKQHIDVSNLAKGIYIVKIKSTDGKIATKKCMKK